MKRLRQRFLWIVLRSLCRPLKKQKVKRLMARQTRDTAMPIRVMTVRRSSWTLPSPCRDRHGRLTFNSTPFKKCSCISWKSKHWPVRNQDVCTQTWTFLSEAVHKSAIKQYSIWVPWQALLSYSSCLYWSLKSPFIMLFQLRRWRTKSTVLVLCKNAHLKLIWSFDNSSKYLQKFNLFSKKKSNNLSTDRNFVLKGQNLFV